MDKMRIVNLTNKNIREFTTEDTIYITRMVGKYRYTYLCKFIKFERGMVYGEVIMWEPNWAHRPVDLPMTVKSRLTKCYLWGKSSLPHESANWFNKMGNL